MYPNLFHLPEWVPLLGGEPVTSFGVMMFLSFMAAGYVAHREMPRVGVDPDVVWDLLMAAVIGGIVGAKVYYLFLHFPLLLEDPAGLVFSRGGLVFHGGLIGGLIALYWTIRRLDLPLGRVLDVTALSLPLGYAVGRIGCFLVGDDYGRPTDSWVGIAFPEGAPPTRVDVLERIYDIQVDPALVAKYGEVVPVHPTQLYEVAMSGAIFLFLWKIRRHPHEAGWLFSLWLVLAGVERILVELVRVKDDRYLGFLSVAQTTSLVLVAVGAYALYRLWREPAARETAPAGAS